MTCHELRAWPAYFGAVWSGEKTFKVRYDDRGYQAGDTVLLREWDYGQCRCIDKMPHQVDCAGYSGRSIAARIGYVLASTPGRASRKGFNGFGYVVLSLCEPVHSERTPGPAGVARVHAASVAQ